MMRHSVPKYISGIAFLALIFAQCLPNSSAKSQLASQLSVRPALHASPDNLRLLGDFDGDQRLDRAELHLAGAHCCVRVQFGNSQESHLAFHAPYLRGALLTRDINHDNKPDLVWVSLFQSERAVVWLGDGLGHFLEAASQSADAGLRTLLFGDPDPGIAGIVKDEHVFLIPDPVSSELAGSEKLDTETCNAVLIAGGNDHRDPGLYLSYLRERGPPLHTSLV